ncbi:superoxide dismutase [Kiritimatiellaeota bacterium B1221]|nr:superoxide dismutase [Kiritimatiellaeota bacterium B1221]
MNMTRREALKRTAVLGAAAAFAPGMIARGNSPSAVGEYELMDLPYAFDALEPAVDAGTMKVHYQKHHAGYVRKLNAAMKDVSPRPSLEDLLAGPNLSDAVRNNGGGTYNHNIFWKSMAPIGEGGGGEPQGDLAARLRKDFGSVEDFRTQFSKAAGSVFGSGWAWLVVRESDGKLVVVSTGNQDNPLMKSVLSENQVGRPLLGLDVWEHAYYLHYQNRRTDYIANWWKVVNWNEVSQRLG